MSVQAAADPLLSTGRRRSEVLSATVIARPNGRGKPTRPRATRLNRLMGRSTDPIPRLTWLLEAAEGLRVERVEALLTCPGINVDKASKGVTALVLAVQGYLQPRSTGAYFSEKTHQWARRSWQQIIERLLAAGASPHANAPDGVPLLAHAIQDEWLRDALLAAGANPLAGRTTLPLLEAFARGDPEAAEFWWKRAKPVPGTGVPNPWRALLPHLLPPAPSLPPWRTSWVSPYEQPAPPPRFSTPLAWRWARRLMRAGWAPSLPLADRPTPPEIDKLTGRPKSLHKVDDVQDSALTRLAAGGNVRPLARALGPNRPPSTPDPNGRHPFMAWVNACWAVRHRPAPSPERLAREEAMANALLTPELARLNGPLTLDFPCYENVHPLGALLNGPCASPHASVRDVGWRLVDRLLALGLSMPPHASPTESSVVDRVLGRWLEHRRFDFEGKRELPHDPRWDRLLARLAGFAAVHATPCLDPYGLTSMALKAAAEDRGMTADRLAELERLGMRWGPAFHQEPSNDLCWHPTPLLRLCRPYRYPEQPVKHRRKDLPVDAIAFVLSHPSGPPGDVVPAFAALLESMGKIGWGQALAAFDRYAPPPGSSPRWLTRAATHPEMTLEALADAFAAGCEASESELDSWPQAHRQWWMDALVNGLTASTAAMSATEARPRPRL